MSTIGGHGSFYGDNGEPLTVKTFGGRKQIGVASFQDEDCGIGRPAVFSRIFVHRLWYDTHMIT